ncbi:MAG: glycosyltransferase family 4 protein [Peptococcaceae bacterium]|nr:glycosyltransferase family 4 protein [Peptococcaceae bacterium]
MRILFVLPPTYKGTALSTVEAYVYRLAAALVKRGMNIYVLGSRDVVPREVQMQGLCILPWPACAEHVLRGIIRDIRPHVVQVENRPALIRGIRHVFNGQLVLNLHNLTHLSGDSISRSELRVALCLVDNIVLGNYYQKSLFLGRFFGLRGRAHVIYPGVDREVFRPYYGDQTLERTRHQKRHGLGLTGRDFVILVVSSIAGGDGIDTLENAVSLAAGAPMKMVLVSTYEDEFAFGGRLLAQEGRTDGINAEDLPALYRAADVCALHGWGRVSQAMIGLEAQASGLPVVTNLRGGIVETVDKGSAFLLRSYDEVTAWTRSLEVLAKDEPLRRKMGQVGRGFTARFNWEQCAVRFLSVYSAVSPPRAFGISL